MQLDRRDLFGDPPHDKKVRLVQGPRKPSQWSLGRLMITKLAISGYRSLRNIALRLGPVNVVTGPNGSGKSSLYRALRLLADVAQGRVIQALAVDGRKLSNDAFWRSSARRQLMSMDRSWP